MPEVPDDVKKIRHQRFLQLLRTKKAVELAGILGVADNYISRVRSGIKSIGEESARDWEKKLGLPKYWFDGLANDSARESTAMYHGVELTRAGALLAAEWEKLDVGDRAELEGEIFSRVAKKKRQERDKTKPREQ